MGGTVADELGRVERRETAVSLFCMRKEFIFNKVMKKNKAVLKKNSENALFCLDLSILVIFFVIFTFKYKKSNRKSRHY